MQLAHHVLPHCCAIISVQLSLTMADGNVYCNITTFNWVEPKVRELWVETVLNATKTGLVDGIFADHATGNGVIIGNVWKNKQAPNQLCNGKDAGRRCFNFTEPFKVSFNSCVARAPCDPMLRRARALAAAHSLTSPAPLRIVRPTAGTRGRRTTRKTCCQRRRAGRWYKAPSCEWKVRTIRATSLRCARHSRTTTRGPR